MLKGIVERVGDGVVGREAEVAALCGMLGGEGRGPLPSVLVYGRPECGKSTVVRAVLKALCRRFAWLSCVHSQKPAQAIRSVVRQLRGRKRRLHNEGKVDPLPCNNADLLRELADLVPGDGPPAHIVIDNAHHMGGSPLLSVLMRAHELSGANLSLVLISHMSWASGIFHRDTLRVQPPLPLYFRCYDDPTMLRILGRGLGGHAVAGTEVDPTDFLQGVMKVFLRHTSSLRQLRAVTSHLFAKYREPIEAGEVDPRDRNELFTRVQFHVNCALKCMDGSIMDVAQRGALEGGSAALDATDLPFVSKLLILAAHICSRNRPEVDRAVFDPGYKGRRKHGRQASDRQAEAARDAELRPSHTMELERILAVFRVLFRQCAVDCEEGPEAQDAASGMYSAEVLTQLRSLVSLKLLSQVSGDLLEGAKYQSNIPDSMARKIASNVQIDLGEFLVYC
eukprot:evm.model.scf_1537.3 EVM.evm.TU.scf_1537.3   scf_1537:26365-33075(+)